jgi:hypothetical protein
MREFLQDPYQRKETVPIRKEEPKRHEIKWLESMLGRRNQGGLLTQNGAGTKDFPAQ